MNPLKKIIHKTSSVVLVTGLYTIWLKWNIDMNQIGILGAKNYKTKTIDFKSEYNY